MLEKKFGKNLTEVVEFADRFLQSIGFPAPPSTFYEKSRFKLSDWPEGKVGEVFQIFISELFSRVEVWR